MRMVFAALAFMLLPKVAIAQSYIETNAGQTLATASDTTLPDTGASLTSILGTLTSDDADLFRIYISAPGSFFASTNNEYTNNGYSSGGPLDTALFLLSSDGDAIATNDDANGLDITSTLSASNSVLSSLAAGYYYLGVSVSGNEPVNSANQLLFQGYPGGDTTATRGAATGLNPTALMTFNDNDYDSTPGVYQIDLAGVTAGPVGVVAGAVPEPATWAMWVLGFGIVGLMMRCRHDNNPRFTYTS